MPTRAPSATRRRAMPRPMPRLAPVTRRSCRRDVGSWAPLSPTGTDGSTGQPEEAADDGVGEQAAAQGEDQPAGGGPRPPRRRARPRRGRRRRRGPTRRAPRPAGRPAARTPSRTARRAAAPRSASRGPRRASPPRRAARHTSPGAWRSTSARRRRGCAHPARCPTTRHHASSPRCGGTRGGTRGTSCSPRTTRSRRRARAASAVSYFAASSSSSGAGTSPRRTRPASRVPSSTTRA